MSLIVITLSFVGGFNFIGPIIAKILPGKYSSYVEYFMISEFDFGVRVFFEYLVVLTVYFVSNSLSRNQNGFVFSIIIVGFTISFVAMSFPLLYRLAYYFVFFKIVYLSGVFTNKPSKHPVNMVFLILLIISFYILLLFLNINSNTFDFLPYKNIYL